MTKTKILEVVIKTDKGKTRIGYKIHKDSLILATALYNLMQTDSSFKFSIEEAMRLASTKKITEIDVIFEELLDDNEINLLPPNE